MKFVLLSDVHLSWKNPIARLDDVSITQMKKLKYVFDWADENRGIILQAGDLFDSPRSWYLLAELTDFFQKNHMVDFYTIYGQHDTYLYSEETKESTIMGILEKAKLLKIMKTDECFSFSDICGHWHVYGTSWGQKIFNNSLFSEDDISNILVIHAPISDRALYPGQEFTLPKKFLKDHPQFDLVLCGDVHRHFVEEYNGRFLVNTGPMIRRTADMYNYEHKPCFYVFDTTTKELVRHIIPHEPAENVLSRSHIDMKKESDLMLDAFISSVDSNVVDDVSFEDNLMKFVKRNKIEQQVIDIISKVMIEGE